MLFLLFADKKIAELLQIVPNIIVRGVKTMQVRVLKDFKCTEKCEINVIPFGVIGEIDFKKQLSGGAEELVKLGRFSALAGDITLLGCVSDNYGIKKRSVFVFERGKLTSICDMNSAEEGFSPSAGYKIFSSGNRKIGVLVDKDLYSPMAVSSLAAVSCSVIIDLYEGFSARKAEIAAEFYAYAFGVNFVLVSENAFFAFDSYGDKILIENQKAVLPDLKICREVRLKKRGANIY